MENAVREYAEAADIKLGKAAQPLRAALTGRTVSPSIFAISSDEPTASDKGAGGKRHAPDAFGLGTDTALLRAERSGAGDGRVYVVHFFADDGGERCKGSVEVRVPHDKRSKDCWAVDSGQDYDATETN